VAVGDHAVVVGARACLPDLGVQVR
jgi:hypothetical protein